MLSYNQALKKLLAALPEPEETTVALDESLGLVLAETVNADLNLPPFDKSFMDGYAIHAQDLINGPKSLRIAGIIAAGESKPIRVEPGFAWQIMTGAMVPQGTGAVQMVEKTRRRGGQVEILEMPALGANIAPRACEVKQGDRVLDYGRPIGPAEIGVLATFGRAQVRVFRRLRVAIAATGDELVAIDSVPQRGQIRNSNTHMLHGQCRSLGLEADLLPIVADEPEAIRKALRLGLEHSDVLIMSGGVSMGEFDFVHRLLQREGIEVFFHKAAIKPGKPLIVGRRGSRMVFGLPGNPVSSFVTFEVFARPALRKWMGFKQHLLPIVKARLTESIRHKPGRLFFKPARTWLDEGVYHSAPVDTRGSADIVAFARCNSMILFPAETTEIGADTVVDVMLLEGRQG